MRYRLRTMLILLAIGPPIVECGWHVAVWRSNHRLGRRLVRDNLIEQVRFNATFVGSRGGPHKDDVDLFELQDAGVAGQSQNRR